MTEKPVPQSTILALLTLLLAVTSVPLFIAGAFLGVPPYTTNVAGVMQSAAVLITGINTVRSHPSIGLFCVLAALASCAIWLLRWP